MKRLRLEELQVQSCLEVTMPETLGGGRFRANKRS